MADALRISVEEAKTLLGQGRALVLDVVSPAAWDQLDVAIPGSLRVPPDEVNARVGELPRERTLIAYCT